MKICFFFPRVLCVGGDGTFSEVLNGMLDRVNADEGVDQSFRHQPARPRLHIGVIPAGRVLFGGNPSET